MYSGKSKHAASLNVDVLIRRFHLAGLKVGPSFQTHVIVKKQISVCLTAAHKKRGVRRPAAVIEFSEVHIADNVYIMDKNQRVAGEKTGGFLYSASGIKKLT